MGSTTEAPAHIETLYGAALWLLEQQRVDDAIHLFRFMLLAAPTDERGWLGLGICHEQRDEETIALELYRRAADATSAPRCAIARAKVLQRLGRADEAADALDTASTMIDDADDEVAALLENARRAA